MKRTGFNSGNGAGPLGIESNGKIRPRAQIRSRAGGVNSGIKNNISSTKSRKSAVLPQASGPTTVQFLTNSIVNVDPYVDKGSCTQSAPGGVSCSGTVSFVNLTTNSNNTAGTTYRWVRKTSNCGGTNGNGQNSCASVFSPNESNNIFPPIAGAYPTTIEPYIVGKKYPPVGQPDIDFANFVVTYIIDPANLTDADLAVFSSTTSFPGYQTQAPSGPITTVGSSGTIYQPYQLDNYNTFILPNLCSQVDTTVTNCPVDPNEGPQTPCSKFISSAFSVCNSFYTQYTLSQISNQAMANVDTVMGQYCGPTGNGGNVDCQCVNSDTSAVFQQVEKLYEGAIPNKGCWFVPCQDTKHFLIPEDNLQQNAGCPKCATICNAIINLAGANANDIVNDQNIACSGPACNWTNPCTGPTGCPTGPCSCANGCMGTTNADGSCNCSGCPTGGTGPTGSTGPCACPGGCIGTTNSDGTCDCSGCGSFWDKYKYYIIGGIVVFIIILIVVIGFYAYSKKKKKDEAAARAKRSQAQAQALARKRV